MHISTQVQEDRSADGHGSSSVASEEKRRGSGRAGGFLLMTRVDVTAGCISKTQCPEGIPPKVISVGVRSHRTLSVMVRENHYNHYLKNKNKNKQTHTTHNKHAETLQKYYTTLCACLWPWSPSTFPKKITPPPPTQVSPPAVSWGWHCHALLEQNANAAAA